MFGERPVQMRDEMRVEIRHIAVQVTNKVSSESCEMGYQLKSREVVSCGGYRAGEVGQCNEEGTKRRSKRTTRHKWNTPVQKSTSSFPRDSTLSHAHTLDIARHKEHNIVMNVVEQTHKPMINARVQST